MRKTFSNLGFWLISAVYWGLFLILYLQSGPGKSIWSLILLAVGLVVGNLLIFGDRKWLKTYYGGQDLMTQSLLFLLAMAPLGLFVVTSTGSWLGIGIVVGFEIQTSWLMYKASRDIELFHRQYLVQLKRKLTRQEIGIMVVLQVLVTVLLILLSLV
jgi:hypothetical protein